MMQVPKWLFYGMLVCSFGCAITMTVLFGQNRSKKVPIIQTSTDSLALAQKDVLIQQLQTKIDRLSERDSLLAEIDRKLADKMNLNEKDLRNNIDRVRQLNADGAARQLSANLSESLAYRRRYDYLFQPGSDSNH